MKVAALCTNLSGRVQFRFSESARVPESSGCYTLANIHDDVLYIGQSVDLCRRMQDHLDTPRMTRPTSLGLAVWFYYGLWPSAEIDVIEAQLLFHFKAVEGKLPPLNRVGP